MPPQPEPVFADILKAAQRIAPFAVATPLLDAPALSERLGGRIHVKAEVLQRTGSFKFRGAMNRILMIPEQKRAQGVVAWSSGNHAQAVAAVARMLGIQAAIVMPADAPALKIEATQNFGAEVILYDRWRESREEIGRNLAAKRGATLVPPYDDPGIVAGQGTLGLEVHEQWGDAPLDAILVPCSGGGLSSGIALALEHLRPETRIWVAEPLGFDDTGRSLAAGKAIANSPGGASICDALMAPEPGGIPFAILKRCQAGGVAVSDEDVLAAMQEALLRLKLAVEPGGAAGLAALLSGRFETRGKNVAVILSGGNADPGLLQRALLS